MGTIKIKFRTDRHHPGWVNGRVALVIVVLDMVEMHRLADTRMLIKRLGVIPEIGIFVQHLAIAFEMPVIDRIKPQQGRE